jgi:polysaccharide biosynthesis protein PslG
MVRAWTAAVAVAAGMAIFAAGAQALPGGFWGAVPQSNLSSDQYQRLGDGGVESIRIPVGWGSVQPTKNGPFVWGSFDAQVEEAARAGIKVLPFLSGAPEWAVRSKKVPGAGGLEAPAHLPVNGAARGGWIAFLTAAVARYGPRGSFWSQHPGVPKRAIRFWQIWNEPNFKYFVARPNPGEYGKLVKISYTALKAADPGARLVLAGLFSRPKGARTASGKHKSLNWYASDFLARMYKTTGGLKRKFNGAALHPYTIHAKELPRVTEEFRRVLIANKDAGKGLWMTELGWSSGRPSRGNKFAKGVGGQARELKTSFKLLRNKQAKWNVKTVFWFSVDDSPGACNFCDGSGLFSEGFEPKKSWYTYVRFAGGTP